MHTERIKAKAEEIKNQIEMYNKQLTEAILSDGSGDELNMFGETPAQAKQAHIDNLNKIIQGLVVEMGSYTLQQLYPDCRAVILNT